MRLASAFVFFALFGCAHDPPEAVQPFCCTPSPAAVADDEFIGRIDGPETCERAARSRLAASPDDGWSRLWRCVARGRFTALRNVLDGAWDHELQTRPDAPWLVARMIAERGGDVDDDLRLVHERRVPMFALSQVLARPDLYRHAIVIVRARLAPSGLLSETKLVSQMWDVPWWGAHNLDVATGTRAIGLVERDPFVDGEEPVVVLGRFDGLRDGDDWPVVSVLGHFRPSATVTY